MARHGRTPRVAHEPHPKKRPSTGSIDPEANSRLPVTWRLNRVDLGGSWGWDRLIREQVAGLLVQLVALERQTFAELRQRQLANSIPIAEICREAQERLVEIEQNDTDEIWELRIPTNDNWRAWGSVTGAVFSLIWWDPEHTVCRHPPRSARRKRGSGSN